MEKKKHKIQEVSSSENKQYGDVAYLVAFFLLLDALKKYKRLRYGLYFSLFIILAIIVAIGLVISCQWIDDNNTKLFFLGGIGWLLAYWFTKSKELSQNSFNLKKQYSGTAALGIEAIMWKVKGLTGSEIADKYNVTPNLVGAWISRAVKKLQNDSVFNLYMEDLLDKKAS